MVEKVEENDKGVVMDQEDKLVIKIEFEEKIIKFKLLVKRKIFGDNVDINVFICCFK